MDNQAKEITESLDLGLTIQDIAKITGGSAKGFSANTLTTTITTDSRKAKKDSVFVALRGERFDGHSYIDKAFENGAVLAIIDTLPSHIPSDKCVVMVDDTVVALNDIAEHYLRRLSIPVAAITGSVGKTTTKELLYSILSTKYRAFKTDKNNNNEIGMPMTILSCPAKTEVLVLEMGMMAIGDIELLSTHAHPDVAVITNIGMAHIGFPTLGSKEKIKEAKLEILKGMKPSGTIVLNGDDKMLISEKGKTGVKEIFFAIENESCTVLAKNIVIHSNFSEFDIVDKSEDAIQMTHVKLPIAGKQMIYNALAAYCAASALGISREDAADGIANLKEKGVHLKMEYWGKNIIIDDCYNASPDSVKSSLSVLQHVDTCGRRIAVLGDMLGYGDYTESVHKDVGREAAELGIDLLFTYGAYAEYTAAGAIEAGMNPDNIHVYTCSMKAAPLESKGMKVNRAFEYEDRKLELAKGINDVLSLEDAVLFKASRNIYLETAIEELHKIIKGE